MAFANIRARLVGASKNEQCSALLTQLAKTALEAAVHLRKTGGQDRPTIIDFEHAGDGVERQIHELLDSAFIMRFDKSDIAHLAWELDEVVDGMKKVTTHIEVHKAQLKELSAPAQELLQCIEHMAGQVVKLIEMLSRPRYDLSAVKKLTGEMAVFEKKADNLRFVGKGAAAKEYDRPGASPVAFHAWVRLYSLLEEVTDSANHVGSRILSMVRREA